MDCIITFKILFKILGTLTLQAFLNEFKNRLTSALLQGGPFQNVQCLLAAHSTSHYPSSPVLEGFKVLFTTFPATAPHTYPDNRPLVGFYYQTIFFAPVIVKQMGKNLDLNLVMANKVCQSQFVISRLFHCSCSGSVDKKHKRSTESNYGTAPVDPFRPQNRGSHDYDHDHVHDYDHDHVAAFDSRLKC